MSFRRAAPLSYLAIALLLLVWIAVAGDGAPTVPTRSAQRGAAEELEEQAERTERRLEALEEAEREGVAGQTGRIRDDPVPGWAGAALFDRKGNDWEPAVAADPNEPFAYIATTRYGGKRACNQCPSPNIVIEVSKDNGKTWSHPRFVCECPKIKAQYDPQLEATTDGTVYAVWLSGFNFKPGITFSKSTDHGRTWSERVVIVGDVNWSDKPVLATSPSGRHIYVAFNGPTAGDNYVAQSHDFGDTWQEPIRTTDSHRYFFAFGGNVAPDGTVTFSLSSLSYAGPGLSAEGAVRFHSLFSTDRGATWRTAPIDSVQLGSPCESEGCYADFYDGNSALAGDERGDLVVLYTGASAEGGPRTMFARRSTDDGLSWSARTPLSPSGANAAFPAAVATGDGEIRAWFMDDRRGSEDAWNVWYRSSGDGGRTWSKAVRISDATSGADYKDRKGFLEPYGDYGEIAITSSGKAIAAWGEGFSWFGPGGTWYNRQGR